MTTKKPTVSWRWKRGTHRFPGITDAKTFSLNIHRVVVENGIEKKIEGCVLRVVGDAATYEKAVQVADAVVAELNAGRKTAECFPKSIDARRVEPEEIPSFREEEFIVDRSGLRRRNNRGFAHGRAKLTLEKILYIKDHYVPGLKGGGRVRHPNSSNAVADKVGISPAHVIRVFKGQYWKHLKFPTKPVSAPVKKKGSKG